MAATTLKRFRCDDGLWDRAAARAADEGIDVSTVLRGALEAYASGEEVKRPAVRVTVAERKAAREALTAELGGIVDTVLAAINSQR